MTKLRPNNIRIYVWLFFILGVLSPVCLGAGLVFHLGSDSFMEGLVASITAHNLAPVAGSLDMEPVVTMLKEARLPLMLVFLFILCGSACALFFFSRYILVPINEMLLFANRITNGNMGESLPTYKCYEISRLGESINDLSINFQEIILLVWNATRDSSVILDKIIDNNSCHSGDNIAIELHQDLKVIRDKVQGIEEMMLSFDLYDVHIEDNRAIAATEEPRQVPV